MIEKNAHILIADAGGFIGGWLTKHFVEQGYTKISAVDIKSKKIGISKFQ